MEAKLEEFRKSRTALGIENFRALPSDFDVNKVSIGDDRIIRGYAIVWGKVNSFGEKVLKGATLNSINARGVGSTKNSIVLLKHHDVTKPIARMTVLKEDDYGLYFEAEIIATALGDETIEEVNSKVLRQLSYGFGYVWDKTFYDETDDTLVLAEIKLMEISLVTFSSDENAQLRSLGFENYQKIQLLKEIDVAAIRNLITLTKSRVEHSSKKVEKESEEKSNVKLF